MLNVVFKLVLLQVGKKKSPVIAGLANVSGLQGSPEDVQMSGYGYCIYPGQDFLSRALVIVYSPISNLRHENGVGVKRQLISINYYLHMNADK